MQETIPVCPNCGEDWTSGDHYCRYCGSPVFSPRFVPLMHNTIYGPPPVLRRHTCEACGYAWTTERMLDYECYCPRCGGSAPAVEDPFASSHDDPDDTQPIEILPDNFW